MKRTQAGFQTRSLVVNLIFTAGLVLAVIIATTLLGAGITDLTHKPPFLDPQSNCRARI